MFLKIYIIEFRTNNIGNVRRTYKDKFEVRSRNHCCRGRAVSIVYSVCVRVHVALGTQHAMRMCHIVIYGLSGSTLFFHFFS